MPARDVSDDPLALVMMPPPDETAEERTIRLQREEEARRISEAIDESLRQERQMQKRKRIVKLLLLGQSESGKSTTLRQFQRLYTPSAFREERILWRAVIQLNLVRSIRRILETLTDHQDAVIESISGGEGESDDEQLYLAPEIDELRMRLLPLRHIEQLLIAKLVPPGEDEATHLGFSPPIAGPSSSANFSSVTGGVPSIASGSGGYAESGSSSYIDARYGHGHGHSHSHYGHGHHGHASSASQSHSARNQEIFVRPGTSWKGLVAHAKGVCGGRPHSAGTTGIESPDEATTVLHELRHELMELWHNQTVREVLRKRKVRLEEQPGFFLDELERITSLKYLPSDDDVLKARLKTVGVSEYKFELESTAGRESGTEWRIVDVGGSRFQRPTWIPYFDDVDAIIFLAPISAFDQVLAEDKSVNRLEDSVLLWKMICSNKLLQNVELVLFLNKCDILDRKLRSGIRLAKYVRSYQDRPNDADTAQKYFRAKFSAILREYSPNPRKFYGFCTSVTDITTTSGILASVRDMVIREHLKRSKLL